MMTLAKIRRNIEPSPEMRKKISWAVKFVVSVSTFVYLFIKIKNYPELNKFGQILAGIGPYEFVMTGFIFLLMAPNWMLEAVKWKILLKPIEKINFQKSLIAILGGLTISMLTPNRLGEIPGRASFVIPENRKKTILATTLGSISQAIVTAILGFTSFIILKMRYNFVGLQMGKSIYLIVFSIVGVIVFGWLLVFIVKRTQYFDRTRKYLTFVKTYNAIDISTIQILSIIRYGIFFTQFFILLKIFNVELSFLEGFLSISLTYLVLFITPFLTLAEISVRGTASLICIGFFSGNLIGILLAGFALWLINIGIPAAIGTIGIIKR